MHLRSRATTVLLAASILAALPAAAATVISGPTLTMNPRMTTPLAGVVELETDVPAVVQLTVTDGIDSWVIEPPTPEQVHYIPVAGMKPDRSYSIEVRLIGDGLVDTLMATTPPLPADFPTITVIASDPPAMEPGFTLTDCMRQIGAPAGTPFYSMIVDAGGEVVWYTTHCMAVAQFFPETGEVFYQNQNEVIQMDLVGNQQRTTLAYPGLGAHHDIERTPHGTYVSMDQQLVDVMSFPTSDTDPNAPWAPTTLTDDSIVEFLPDGTLRNEWPTLDLIQPGRIAYESLVVDSDGGRDWTHGNAAHYRQSDDSITISLRHQDAVIKFSRETGDVEWILGPHANWLPPFDQFLLTPVGTPFLWNYHQHAPMWTGADTLLIYDNGNHKASPFDGNPQVPSASNFSRAVEYQIDETNLTVSQIWEYGESIAAPLFTPFIGDADFLPVTGNRLMTFGATQYVNFVSSTDLGLGTYHPRLVEVTDDTPAVRVFELQISDPGAAPLLIYRSERIPWLFPPVPLKSPNGVGDSVVVGKTPGGVDVGWAVPPVDGAHGAAEHYRVYTSTAAAAGFGMAESTANTTAPLSPPAAAVTYIKVVAANLAGTSGDEPSP